MGIDGRQSVATGASQGTTGRMMRAIVQDSYGSADALRSARIDRPDIADDEVLLQVHAAGVDRGTWHLMTGTPYLMRVIGFGFRRPKNRVPGVDVAGTVVAVGSAVTRFAVGDEVFGMSRGSSPSTPRPARTNSPTNRRTPRSSGPRWSGFPAAPRCRP